MVAITNQFPQVRLRNRLSGPVLVAALKAVVQAGLVLMLAQRTGLWPLAILVVLTVELWPLRLGGGVAKGGRMAVVVDRAPALLMGLSVAMIIAVSPRFITQAAAAGLYVVWQVWWTFVRQDSRMGLANLLVVQIALFEAVFLMAAVWRTPSWIVLGLLWLGAYVSVYAVLSARKERIAGVMAATWAVVCVEVGWVLLLWLFVYTIGGGYLLVPQPALVLTALAYCFGNIYVSQREGTLSRGRLVEYLVIGLILIAIVAIGTSWRGGI